MGEPQVETARRLIDEGWYMTLATADADGLPWASPVWYAHEGYRDFVWVSRPDARHSVNLDQRPELAIVIFDSSLSRMDWFLLGILATSAATAEYSIASRAFEISRLPLSVIAPILLARFAPMLSGGGGLNDDKQQMIKDLFRLEMFAIFLIPLVVNI